ncbi:MAG: 30S ribosomal protein S3 [Candidatus Paceibacterota bacterium]|jgi:small subunit ribosomal protein S3
MSHSVHPYSHRLGIIRDWKSRWFSSGQKYKDFLKADMMLREFLEKKMRGQYIGSIEMERNDKTFRLIVKTSRPGVVIGRSGEGSVKLRKEIMKFATKNKLAIPVDFKLDVEEIKSPESNAAIVAQMIAEGLEKRLPFRRVMKQTVEKVMANRDVKGIRLYCGGRLGGAEIARSEEMKKGRVPLQTLRADIDYAQEKAHMTYGDIGIKVWIYKGDIFSARGGATSSGKVK